MKVFLKILGVLAGVVVLVVVGGLIYLNAAYPDVEPPKNIKVERTEARLERGKYLAHHVAVCMDCHSVRDWSKFSGPIKPGTEGMGGDAFDKATVGFPGSIYVKNITPAALGNWTDGELIRAITCGVNKDGEPLFPLMPYYSFNNLGQEDLFAIVTYIRSLEPKKNQLPERELDFPLNLIVRTMPLKTYKPAVVPDKSNPAAYGKYLVTIASCNECHTQSNEDGPIPGMTLAGGQVFATPLGTVRSANITPHAETGIGSWTKEQFIKRFKTYDPATWTPVSVTPGEFNTVMPWNMYAGMTEEDLGYIYEYLKTIKPVRNSVNRFTPPAETSKAAQFINK